MSRPPRTRTSRADSDPLAPLDTVAGLFLALSIAFLLFAAVITVFHAAGKAEYTTVYSFGRDVCIETDAFATDLGENPPSNPYTEPGSRLIGTDSMFCTKEPSWPMQLAASAEGILGTLLTLGGALLTRRVIRTARRDNVFAAAAARQMRTLGWFLIAMSIVGPIGADLGNGIFIASAATAETGLTWASEFRNISGPDWTPLILGICAITFGRVMNRGGSLQEDVAFTV